MEEPYSEVRPTDHHLWSTEDSEDTENEVKEFIYGLIRATKPELVVELGSANGKTTLAMASAINRNGRGKLISFEVVPEKCEAARALIERNGYSHCTEIHCVPVEEVFRETLGKIDILLVDAVLEKRVSDWLEWRDCMKVYGIGLLHDTLKFDPPRSELEQIDDPAINLYTPRGLTIVQRVEDVPPSE